MIVENLKFRQDETKEISENLGKLIAKVNVEEIDILKEMEVLNKRIRDAIIRNEDSEEKVKAYDIGVKNTMSALELLITHAGEEEDRLIYQKYGEQYNVVRYRSLSDALMELQKRGSLHLSEIDFKESENDKT